METICRQCGDKGWWHALVYCAKCRNFAVHRYCMDKLTFDEYVRWFCEDCQPNVPKQYTFQKSSSIPSRKRANTSSQPVEVINCSPHIREKESSLAPEAKEQGCQDSPSRESDETHAEPDLTERPQLAGDCSPPHVELKEDAATSVVDERKQRRLSSYSQRPYEEHTGLDFTKHIQFPDDCSSLKMKSKKKNEGTFSEAETEEHKLLSGPLLLRPEAYKNMDVTGNGHLPSDSPLKSDPKRRDVTHSIANTGEQRSGGFSFPQPCKSTTTIGLTKQAKFRRDCSPPTVKSTRGKEVTSSAVETNNQHCSSQHPLAEYAERDSTKRDALVGKCSDAYEEMRPIPLCTDNHGKEARLEKDRRMILDTHGRAQPVIDPIWRGSFSIINKNYDTFDDAFVAHLSSKACQKVFDEASLFPSLLCFEMLPKSELWPKSFQKSEPSDENIALYFFPVHTRHERIFEHLVDEMRGQELAMRAIVKNAELLVFTSMELPLLYWRFQSKYYLWGVFRGKQAASSHQANCHLMVPNPGKVGAVYFVSANSDVGIEEKRNVAKTKNWDAESPLIPLEQWRKN